MFNLGFIPHSLQVPLRAALAILFLVMSVLQPGQFAFGSHGNHGPGVNCADQPSEVDHHNQSDQSLKDAHDHRNMANIEGGDKDTHSDDSCQLHCATAFAVPHSSSDTPILTVRGFVPAALEASVPLGEYHAPIRPPRTLI